MPKILFIFTLCLLLTPTLYSDARAENAPSVVQDQSSVDNADKAEEDGIDGEKIKRELMTLSPELCDKRIEALRAEHRAQVEQDKQKFEQRWQNASTEERAQFCLKLQHKCEQEDKKYACGAYGEKCNK
tara:strand:+ start:350673 stop:351059 length:387 start_codon:yes stop_codon:yes gene_type:complete